jgi:hypothetical protein
VTADATRCDKGDGRKKGAEHGYLVFERSLRFVIASEEGNPSTIRFALTASG